MTTWDTLTEPVLLQIYKHLSVKDLIACSLTCKNWYYASCDNLLWKRYLHRDFKLKKVFALRDENSNWKEEYRLLVDDVPTVLHETLTAHKDEVLYVAFSNDGSEFVSCSKDHRLIVWTDSEDYSSFKECFQCDMSMFDWKHTWASQFNEDDSKLMVSGVISEINGEIAIFSTGRRSHDKTSNHGQYQFLCRVINDPYDMLGCWCDNNFFLIGAIHNQHMNSMTTTWLCEAIKSPHKTITLEAHRRAIFKFLNPTHLGIYARFLHIYKRNKLLERPDAWPVSDNTARISEDQDMNEDSFDVDAEESAEVHTIGDKSLVVVFICSENTTVPHQIGFQRITSTEFEGDEDHIMSRPEKVVEMNGHIVGIAISPDQTALYVNVRTWPQGAIPNLMDPPCISNQIEMKVLDLHTFELSEPSLSGHIGYTPSEKAFYLYLTASESLVGSGSEDRKGYLWSKHYRCKVGTLKHDACVNSIAIRQGAYDTCAITASDDYTIKIWRTKKAVRDGIVQK